MKQTTNFNEYNIVGDDSSLTINNSSGSLVSFTNGNVGIGTISPTEKFEVNEGFIRSTGSSIYHGFELARDTFPTYQIKHLDGGLTIYNSTDDRKEMAFLGDGRVVINGGNLGIGTTTPSEKFEVNEGFILSNGSSTSHGFELARDNSPTYQIKHLDGGLTIFNLNDTRKEMTFKGNGRIGINNSSPIETLDVNGNIKADGILKLYDITDTQKIELNPNSDSYVNGGNVGIGTTSPIAKLQIRNDDGSSSESINKLAITGGNGGNNLIMKVQYLQDAGVITLGYAGLAGDSIILNGGTSNAGSNIVLKEDGIPKILFDSKTNSYFNSGNVGIGTTNSGTKLHISGDPALNAIGTQSLLRLERPYNVGVSFAQGADIAIGRGNKYPSTQMRFILDNGANNPTNPQTTIMTLDSSGNVGIGTTSPTEILDVNGNIKADGTLKLFDITNIQQIELNPDGDSYILNGNIGIGTTSPSARLHVSSSTGDSVIRMSSPAANTLAFNHYSSYSTLRDLTLNSNRILFFDTGKNNIPGFLGVGISGAEQPSTQLDVRSSTANTYPVKVQGANSNDIVKFYDSTVGGEMYMQDSTGTVDVKISTGASSYFNGGNVGIGTTTPTDKLDVSGNIKSSGYINGKRCGAAGYLASPVNITVTTANTYYPIGVFTVPVAADFIVGTTYPNGLKYTGTIAQTFHITWNATIESTSNNVSSIIDIEKNGVSIPMAKMGTYSKTGGEIYNLNGQCVVDLDVNDEIRFVVTANNNGEILTFDYFTASIKEFFD